jgi:hypothetical protein
MDPSFGDLVRNLKRGNRPRDGGDASGEVEPGPPGPQLCGDIDMRIGRDGTWFYHGSPIGRKPLVKLFAGVLGRDDAGDYWLETPFEKCRIQVDDAPFTAVEMLVEGDGRDRRIEFRTNLDEKVIADADHPIRVALDPDTAEPSPYVYVRDGLEALIVRAVFYDLVELGEEIETDGETVLGVWSAGEFFTIGALDEALDSDGET